jgi:hypothetical protein
MSTRGWGQRAIEYTHGDMVDMNRICHGSGRKVIWGVG